MSIFSSCRCGSNVGEEIQLPPQESNKSQDSQTDIETIVDLIQEISQTAFLQEESSPESRSLPVVKSVEDAVFNLPGIAEEEEPQMRKIYLLLAEDNVVNQKSIKSIIGKVFRNQDFELHIANNGLEYLDLSKKIKFDLIISDQDMPLLNGAEATQMLRSTLNLNQKTPVIGYTTNQSDQDKAEFSKMGMTDFISKPTTFDEITNLFHRYLPDAICSPPIKSRKTV